MSQESIPPSSAKSTARKSILTLLLAHISQIQSLTFSTLIHAVLVLVLGGTVLFQHYNTPPDFAAGGEGIVNDDQLVQPPNDPPPTVTQPQTAQTAPEINNVATSTAMVSAITSSSVSAPSFNVASLSTNMPTMKSDKVSAPVKMTAPQMSAGGLTKDVAQRIAAFTSGWAKGGTASYSQPIKSREFEFTAYLAKYQGGDWDSTVQLDPPDNHIWAGSLPNLLYIISKLSKKKIHAEPQAQPLDLSSDEIFVKKPPFIWFTGHRDFKLTAKEVEVLGEYLRRGGCIWGDSSLPGERSRFDIAFRREMLRLVPDPNQPWAKLPNNHPIYANAYYSEIKGVAPGVNYYDEPIYSLQGYGGEIAVLYTANDYGDMWQFGIDEKGEFDLTRDEKKRMVAVNEQMWYRRNLYFRNIDPKPLMDSYKFGTNIIIHLLTRWESKIRTVPTMGN